MEKYIPLNAVVVEINRRIASLESIGSENYLHDNFPEKYAMLVTLKSLKFSINTLEVKEVEFDEEADNYWETLTSDVKDSIYFNDFYKIAKHFFELGIKAQKG